MHSELLATCENKYELVLNVARRAKHLKDDIQRDGSIEVNKPIPLAIQEMIQEGKTAEGGQEG
jgi:DNA-directed RNA polymerase subunit K/omega